MSETSYPVVPFDSLSIGLGVLTALSAIAILGFLLGRRSDSRRHQVQVADSKEASVPPGTKSTRGQKRAVYKPAVDKAPAVHHPLEVNTLKGHGGSITAISFSADGRGLATACEDGVVRVFKLDDVTSKSLAARFLRVNVPPGSSPRGVAFGEGAGELLVAASDPKGGVLYMFGPATGQEAEAARKQGKLPPPEIKWEKREAHGGKEILTTCSAYSTYGSGDGSAIAATCTEDGTDVRLWCVKDGRAVGRVDSNQIRNTMAAFSPDGRFLAVAAFTADVKVWEVAYGKDGSVRGVEKVMQLKGHKSAVAWLCFSADSRGVVTASKDGSIRIWNIDVRYQLAEDPKCLHTLPIPAPTSPPSNGRQHPPVPQRIALSPDGKVLAAAFAGTLLWISLPSGAVLASAEAAHDGPILSLVWAPLPHATVRGRENILASSSTDKKVKLWRQPTETAP